MWTQVQFRTSQQTSSKTKPLYASPHVGRRDRVWLVETNPQPEQEEEADKEVLSELHILTPAHFSSGVI